jgi:outer membrane immunogenic protein
MKRHLLASFAFTALVAGPAVAADIPVAYKERPPVVAAYNWTGFYVGAHFGGGVSRQQWTVQDPPCLGSGVCITEDSGSNIALGPIGGGQIGFNWQIGQWVLGIEGDYSFANLKGDHQNTRTFGFAGPGPADFETDVTAGRFSTTVKGLGTIAARIGFASDAIDRTLFYVKAGAAFARTDYDFSTNTNFAACTAGTCIAGTSTGLDSGSQTRWGWTAGVGLEYGLTANLSAKVEYDYLALGTKTVKLQGTSCDTFSGGCSPDSRDDFKVGQNIHLIKFGINYRLGPTAVVAKY